MRWICVGMLFSVLLLSAAAGADPCRLETPEESRRVRSLVKPDTLIVRYCWYCDGREPFPLRVTRIELRRTEPEHVRVTAWADSPPSETRFPLEDLVLAERDGSGPLAAFVRQDVERSNSDTSGYLGPNDPYLLQEKRAQFAMQLRHIREDHEMRTWDELYINGAAADPRLLYVPAGGDRFHSVGHQVGCLMEEAPQSVAFRPVARNPARAAPPTPFIADVTGQCYDGACPRDVWRALGPVEFLAGPRADATRVGVLNPDEEVVPVRTEAHVVGSRIVALRDHERFFRDDIFYLLDSQAEGFFRIWHYGEVVVIDATGIDLGSGWSSCQREDQGCWARGEARPDVVWWAQVRRSSGEEGWVRDPIQHLDGVLRSD